MLDRHGIGRGARKHRRGFAHPHAAGGERHQHLREARGAFGGAPGAGEVARDPSKAFTDRETFEALFANCIDPRSRSTSPSSIGCAEPPEADEAA
jgi:hypothetical protein